MTALSAAGAGAGTAGAAVAAFRITNEARSADIYQKADDDPCNDLTRRYHAYLLSASVYLYALLS